MNLRRIITAATALTLAISAYAQDIRNEKILTDWKFRKDHSYWASEGWQNVTVPHDWTIYNHFDKSNGIQDKGVYRHSLEIGPGTLDGRRHILYFDGAMSNAKIYVNSREAGSWPHSCNSFWCDITDFLKNGSNDIAVLLESRQQPSVQHSGAGLYRKVRHITLPKVHIPIWGTYITTPYVGKDYACITIRTRVEGIPDGTPVTVKTSIKDANGSVIARKADTRKLFRGEVEQQIIVDRPELWSPEHPTLYRADKEIYAGAAIDAGNSEGGPSISIKEGKILLDKATTRFGIRSIEVRPGKGFFLNGEMRKFQGVCMHNDFGPLGAAVNKSAIRHQLAILKDMGCDAIRTSHDTPAKELIELCDEMGLMVITGYSNHFRNNASVVMWCIGNEEELQETYLREDSTRPVTCAVDQLDNVLDSGLASQLDIVGLNHMTDRYPQAYALLPQGLTLSTETESAITSSVAYNSLAADEDYPWCVGQFVWSGFDHFKDPGQSGIVDNAYIPKDRFHLYRSVWNEDKPTLHVLPHWNWKGREGQKTPVHVYTSYPSAELFVNGKSQGKRSKAMPSGMTPEPERTTKERFCLMWDDVVYQPGELKVIAYDQNGTKAMTRIVRTAGKAASIRLTPDRNIMDADGEDLCFINVSVIDENGYPVPADNRLINVKVSGAGSFKAMANGDPSCQEPFHKPQMHMFNGQLTILVQSSKTPGTITVDVSGKGLRKSTVTIKTEAAAMNKHIKVALRGINSAADDSNLSYASLQQYATVFSAAAAITKADPSYESTVKSRYMPLLEKYLDKKRTPYAYASSNASTSTSEKFYDDNIAIGSDLADLYIITGNKDYIQKAEMIWKFVESGLDLKLDGGLYHSELRKVSKDALSNASAAVFAAKLYQATENQDYLDMAKGLYIWTKEKLMDPEDDLYMNKLFLKGEKDIVKTAANSGHMIEAGAILFRITGREGYINDAQRTAKACHERFFTEAAGEAFPQVDLIRGLIELYRTDGEPAYLNDVRKILDRESEQMHKKKTIAAQGSAAEISALIGAL